MDVDEDLPPQEKKKKVVVDDEDEEELADAGPIKVKQKNRAVIQDSDDEDEPVEMEEVKDEKPKMSAKKAGKQRAPLPGWMAQVCVFSVVPSFSSGG